MDRTAQIQIFLLVLVLGFLAGPRVIEALQRLPSKGGTEATSAKEKEVSGIPNNPRLIAVRPVDPYQSIALNAKSAYVWDINAHRRLFARNSDLRLPLASVTKIMTGLAAVELLPGDSEVAIRSEDLAKEGDTGLYAGEIWSLDKLLQFTLVASSNDGASAIAAAASVPLHDGSGTNSSPNKEIFIAHMNDKARAIGLTQTLFNNETGLDVANGESGGYGSARDMAMLFEYVFRRHPELLLPTASARLLLRSESGFAHEIQNTNQDVLRIPGIIGSKTGYTELAGGNLVVVVDIGIDHPVVIAVLGSTREGRFSDVEQLIAATTEAITASPVAQN